MRLKGRFMEYLAITGIIWGAYIAVLVPWMYFIIGMTNEMLFNWLWQGTILELIVSYPIGKLVLLCGPKIKLYCDKL